VSDSTLRVLLVLIGAFHVAQGLIGLFAPGTFFEDIGRYPPQNDHYIGDVGAFYLAAGAGLLVSAWRPSWRVPLLAVGAVWYGVHSLNHLFDVGEARSDARGIFDTVALALAALGSAALAKIAAKLNPSAEGRAP
jgi:hypothetical protein